MTKQEKYAELIIREGVNLKPGQPLFITGYVENYQFVRLVAEAAYAYGAKEVHIRWVDEVISRLTYLHGSEDLFTAYPAWQKSMFEHYDNQHAAYVHIHAANPEAYKGVDATRLQTASITQRKALADHTALTMNNNLAWCVAGAPSIAWAKKVFPQLNADAAMEALWDAILKSSRAGGADPAAEWHKHCETLDSRAKWLNAQQFTSLHYTNSLGTDLTIALPKEHIWEGGGSLTTDGHWFSPNIPTEEIFTAPHRLGVNGCVMASMPLVYQGDVIENIELTFKDGLVTAHKASKNQALLENLLAVDEGSRRLGEVALVPYDSPISNQNILFYDTLYDENASCHLALGKAYPTCLAGSVSLTKEQQLEAGLNESLEHEDFMIGTADLSIVGTKSDGTTVDIFAAGNFAF